MKKLLLLALVFPAGCAHGKVDAAKVQDAVASTKDVLEQLAATATGPCGAAVAGAVTTCKPEIEAIKAAAGK